MRFRPSASTADSRLPIVLNRRAWHNVLNALAAIAVATEVQVPTRPSSRPWPSSRVVAASSVMARNPAERRRHFTWSTTTAITRWKWRHAGGSPGRLPGPPPGPGLPATATADPRLFEDFGKGFCRRSMPCVLGEAHVAGEAPSSPPMPHFARAPCAWGQEGGAGVRRGYRRPACRNNPGPRWRRGGVDPMGAGSIGAVPGKLVEIASQGKQGNA